MAIFCSVYGVEWVQFDKFQKEVWSNGANSGSGLVKAKMGIFQLRQIVALV